MRPLATILLDIPGSAGPVRGVVCWLSDDQVLRVYTPDGDSSGGEEVATDISTITEALDTVSDLYRSPAWDLQWLAEADDYTP